jgi:hypothetical protein
MGQLYCALQPESRSLHMQEALEHHTLLAAIVTKLLCNLNLQAAQHAIPPPGAPDNDCNFIEMNCSNAKHPSQDAFVDVNFYVAIHCIKAH